jgi:hypothetical protein
LIAEESLLGGERAVSCRNADSREYPPVSAALQQKLAEAQLDATRAKQAKGFD